jgi:hypothetical protein
MYTSTLVNCLLCYPGNTLFSQRLEPYSRAGLRRYTNPQFYFLSKIQLVDCQFSCYQTFELLTFVKVHQADGQTDKQPLKQYKFTLKWMAYSALVGH